MYKILLTLFLPLNLFASGIATVSGKIKNPTSDLVQIYKQDYLFLKKQILDTCILNKDGSFTLKTTVDGITPVVFKNGEEITHLTLYPNQNLLLTLDVTNFGKSLKFSGDGANVHNFEIAILNEGYEIGGLENMNLSEEKFLELAKYKEAECNRLWNKYYRKAETDFEKELFKRSKLLYQSHFATRKFVFSNYYEYRMQSIDTTLKPLSPSFFEFARNVDYEKEELIDHFSYADLVIYGVRRKAHIEHQKDSSFDYNLIYVNEILKIKAKKVKAYLLANNILFLMRDSKNYSTVDNALLEFEKENLDEKIYSTLVAKFEKTKAIEIGKLAPEVKGLDINGQFVSSKDFIGKIIYIDVWASWCIPCVKEIPFSKEIHKQLEGLPIVFLNISTDSDEKKWLAALEKHKPKGYNILSKFAEEGNVKDTYNIEGIPRFILIDKEGKLINDNAPRPSDKKTLDLLKKLATD